MGGRFDLIGWVLFTISGIVFLLAALRDGDILLLWGSITWLVGVVFFLAGHGRRRS
ncbi:MAG: hypothetical protein OXF41_21020 [bacterium]|nr:hypothetical protein [bacterium]